MPAPARLISPELAFSASLKVAKRADSQGKGTITKQEAEKALRQLDSPQTSQAERARIVAKFLDGNEAKALSPKAREVLAQFVKSNKERPVDGDNIAAVKAAARTETQEAEINIQKAQDKLQKLLSTSRPGSSEIKATLQQVGAWLDSAEADVMQAKAQLKKISANPAAKSAAKELGDAQKEIAKAAEDVQALISAAKGGGVKKADLQQVRDWLAAPLPELQAADDHLGPARFTRKFPSDHEDGHGGGDPGGVTTAKAPSDHEDHGGGGIDATTAKHPSDAEDGGAIDPGTNTRPNADGVKPQRIDQLRKEFNKVNLAGDLDWKATGVIESHLGVRFARVLLHKDPFPDGYTYTAFIPIGALSPTAPKKDPNKVSDIYVERSGGLAGTTMSVQLNIPT